jgi:hypothetical protein
MGSGRGNRAANPKTGTGKYQNNRVWKDGIVGLKNVGIPSQIGKSNLPWF